jgi:hypothetical protein
MNMDQIINSDVIAKEDLLGRAAFARQIVKSLSTFFGVSVTVWLWGSVANGVQGSRRCWSL